MMRMASSLIPVEQRRLSDLGLFSVMILFSRFGLTLSSERSTDSSGPSAVCASTFASAAMARSHSPGECSLRVFLLISRFR